MTGVSFVFGDRPAVWREVPTVPRRDEVLVYDGNQYRVVEVKWYGTDHTWTATVRCTREAVEAE